MPVILDDEFLDEQISKLDYNKSITPLKNHSDIKGTTIYFQIKSCRIENIRISQREEVWATSPENTLKLLEAYLSSDNVILVFSVNASRKFYGYARMISLPQKELAGYFGAMEQSFLGPCFKVQWISTNVVPFEQVDEITNSLNGNLPVKIARDGQELDEKAGAELCEEIDGITPKPKKSSFEELSVESLSTSTDNSLIETTLKEGKKGVEESVTTKKYKNEYKTFRVIKKKIE